MEFWRKRVRLHYLAYDCSPTYQLRTTESAYRITLDSETGDSANG